MNRTLMTLGYMMLLMVIGLIFSGLVYLSDRFLGIPVTLGFMVILLFFAIRSSMPR
jgi:hypothetical protein